MSSCAAVALSLADAMRAVYGKHMLPDHLRQGRRGKDPFARILAHCLFPIFLLRTCYIVLYAFNLSVSMGAVIPEKRRLLNIETAVVAVCTKTSSSRLYFGEELAWVCSP